MYRKSKKIYRKVNLNLFHMKIARTEHHQIPQGKHTPGSWSAILLLCTRLLPLYPLESLLWNLSKWLLHCFKGKMLPVPWREHNLEGVGSLVWHSICFYVSFLSCAFLIICQFYLNFKKFLCKVIAIFKWNVLLNPIPPP